VLLKGRDATMKKQSFAWALWVAAGLAGGLGHAVAQQTKVASVRPLVRIQAVSFDVPAQPLGDAIAQAAQEADVNVMWWAEVGQGLMAPRLEGSFTPQNAFAALLVNTPLRADFVDAHTVVIRTAAQAKAAPSSPPLSRPRPSATVPSASNDGTIQHTAEAAGPTRDVVPEVLVTAQKSVQPLRDVPVPVTAIAARSLVENNQPRLQDYFSSAPGLNVSPAPGAGGQQMLVIRGISAGAFTNPTVGVVVDDIPFGASTTSLGNVVPDFDPGDLARIEVLRGPQGTLYGASSMGGLIKFVTIDPSTERFSGGAQVGLNTIANGSNAGYGVHGSVNIPVSERFAIRASGQTRETPGYIDNSTTGQKGVNAQRVSGGRLSALWRPSEAVSLKLSALYQSDRSDGADEVNPSVGDLTQTFIPGVGGYERATQAYSAILNATLDSVTLTSLTGYNVNEFSNSTDQTSSTAAAAKKYFGVGGASLEVDHGRTNKFSQELRLGVPIGERVEWLLGGFYTDEKTNVPEYSSAENILTGVVVGRLLDTEIRYKFAEYAAFTDLTLHFTDRFDVQLGARQSYIRLDRLAQTTTGAQFPTPAFAAEQFSHADAFTYLLTPRFRINDDVMVYARMASGYRPGGPNNALCTRYGTFPCQFTPDKTENYEIGAKGVAWGEMLDFDASVFYIDWKNVQINLLDPVSTFFYNTNGSKAKSQGVELSLELRPADGLSISSWVDYTDAVLTEPFPPQSTAYGADGDRLPFSARFSGTLATDYEMPLTARLKGTVGATVSYVGERIGTFVGTPARQVYPGYARVDLRVGVKGDSWIANVYAVNVANKRGLIGGGIGTSPPTAFVYIQPRTVGMSLSKSF
jgi:iron complex outermembrane recepter protein